MSLKEQITEDMKSAMRAKEVDRLSTIRMLLAAMKQKEVDERVTLVTRQLADEHLLYMLFITPERDAGNYRNVLNAMVSSMQIDTQRRH